MKCHEVTKLGQGYGRRRRKYSTSRTARIFAIATAMISFPQAAHSFATDGWVSRSNPSILRRPASFVESNIHPLKFLEVASPRQHSHSNLDSSRMYKNFVDEPMPLGSEEYTPSFEQRMRERFAKNGGVTTPSKSRRKSRSPNLPPNVQKVDTLEEYKTVVGDEKERLVVVRFYARWCMSCKNVAPSFYRLAKSYPNVKFVEVPVTENNANLHQGLGVPSIPFCHIYNPVAGLVEEMRVSRKTISAFGRILRSYVDGLCEVPDGDYSNPYGGQTAATEPDD